MSKIKTLVLDAGGVLVHPLHGDWSIPVKYREFLGCYVEDVGNDKWKEACRAEAALIREDIYIKDMEEERGMRLNFLKAVAKRMDWELSEDTFEAMAEDFTYNVSRYAWYEDTLPWLKDWHSRIQVGILSDAMPSFPHVVRNHEACRYIDALVISTEIGTAKPDAKMYLEICKKLNAAPEDCLFVDDRVCNLEGAMRIGMHAVQMCRDGMIGWDGDKVRDLTELNRYLEGLN